MEFMLFPQGTKVSLEAKILRSKEDALFRFHTTIGVKKSDLEKLGWFWGESYLTLEDEPDTLVEVELIKEDN